MGGNHTGNPFADRSFAINGNTAREASGQSRHEAFSACRVSNS